MIDSTKIRARYAGAAVGEEFESELDYFLEMTVLGDPFECPIWTGNKELWCSALVELEGMANKIVAMEIAGHKYKVSINQRFLVIRTKATRDREHETYAANDSLAWIRAEDMHIGDRLYYPAYDNIRKDWNKQDKQTGLGFLAVNKLRIQDLSEEVAVYRMNVSRYHHILLPSGIIASA